MSSIERMSSSSSSLAPTAHSEPSWTGWIETTGDGLLILEAARRGLIPRFSRPLTTDFGCRMINSGSVFVFQVDEDESGVERWADGLRWSPGRISGNFLWYREIDQEDRGQGIERLWLGPLRTDSSNLLDAAPRPRLGGPKSKSGGLIKKIFSLKVVHVISYYRIEDVETGRLCPPSSLPQLSSLNISPEFLDKALFRNPPKIEISPDGVPSYRPPVLALPPLPNALFSNALKAPTSSHAVGRELRERRGNDGTYVRPMSPGRRMRLDFIAPEHSRGLSQTMSWSSQNPLPSGGSNEQVFLLLQQIIYHDRRPGLPGEGSLWIRNLLATHEGPVLQRLADFIQSQLDYPSHLHFFPSRLRLSRKAFDRRCLRILRYLSDTHHILPMSLTIADIIQHGHRPVAGGGFADIWRGILGEQPVCLKVLRLIIEPDENVRKSIRKQFYNEALIWRQLKHTNILPLLGVNVELFSPSFCLISPWMANKDVISYLKQHPSHSRLSVFLDISAGLSYLHTKITHGDIRGANILVTDDLHCCLADFGLALTTSDSQAWSVATTGSMKGAIRWMAPELMDTNGITDQVLKSPLRDIFALGCTMLEKTDYAVLACLMSGKRPARPEHVWCPDYIWNLIIRCWAQEPAHRPDAQQVFRALGSFV